MKDFTEYPKKLSEIKQEIPFRIPDHYFDHFYSRLEQKIKNEPSALNERSLYRFLKPALAVAASLAILAMLLYGPMNSILPGKFAKSGETDSGFVEEDFYTMVSNLDENSFYEILDNGNKKQKLSDDDIDNLVNATFTEYEIFIETNKPLK